MKILKKLILAISLMVPCVLWLITSYYSVENVSVHISNLFYQPPVPAMKAGVKTVHQPVQTVHQPVQTVHQPVELLSASSWKEKKYSQMMNAIKRFVFFIGTARSGHSIVGTLMDAHPHVIIANEYYFYQKWEQFYNTSNQNWPNNLFNLLYSKSKRDVTGNRKNINKGYSLKVSNLWQGTVDHYLEVIGDNCAENVNKLYNRDKNLFQNRLKILQNKLSIPIHVIHVIRNPFDQIATRSLYNYCNYSDTCTHNFKKSFKANYSSPVSKLREEDIMLSEAQKLFHLHHTSIELTELLGTKNVLEVHSSDFIEHPQATLSRIFEFLEVDASEHYLEACADKVFKSTSRTREMVFWSQPMKHMVEEKIKNYEFLSRYNFTNN